VSFIKKSPFPIIKATAESFYKIPVEPNHSDRKVFRLP
jgi:hypothetical protein